MTTGTRGGLSLDERFTVLEQIGEGGFGRVYLAEQHEPVRRRVALKVLKPGMDTREVIERFEAERQTLARLEHPNIARVYEAGASLDGYPFFAMEYVAGAPLSEFAEREKLGLRERLALFCEVCRGVQHAHLNGIIHRDLKPGNVLARRDDGGQVSVRIIDFGIAKATSPGHFDGTVATKLRQAMGTLEYMAPEQADGRDDIDARADVYSLGAMLYELLAGAPPFDRATAKGAGLGEVLEKIREREPRRPSVKLQERAQREESASRSWRSRDLAGDLDWIVLRTLEKDRARRYQSVDALTSDIRAYLEDEPVQACPPSTAYRIRKFVRRHRTWSVAVAVTTVALIAGTVVSVILAVSAEKARGNAAKAEELAERARDETARTFSRADYQQGCSLLRDGQFGAGVAHLCRSLRSDPGNRAAADRLCTTLAYTNFLVPLVPEAHHPSSVVHLFFRNDDEFVTVSRGGVAGIWSRATGARRGEWLQHDQEVILGAAHTPDGRHLGTLTEAGTVRVWDLEERTLRHRWKASPGGAICFLQDTFRVVAGSASGWVRAWHLDSGKLSWERQFGHSVSALDAAPDGDLLAVAGGQSALVLAAATGEVLQAQMAHDASTRRARFDPIGRRVLTCSEDGTARIWDALTGDPLVLPLRHDALVYDALWAPDGDKVATLSFDRTARVWKAGDGSPVTEALRHEDHVYAGVFLEGGKLLVTGSRDQRLRVWSLPTGELARAPTTHERSVAALAVDSSRRQVLTGGRHEQARLLDLRPRAAVAKRLRFPGTVAFSQSHLGGRVLRTLFRAEGQLKIGLVDLLRGTGLGRPLDLGARVRIDAAKTCGHMVVQQGARTVRIFANTKGDLLLDDWEHPCDLAWIEIDAGGEFVFLGGSDGNATLLRFDSSGDRPRFRTLRQIRPFNDGPVDDVIISGDPAYLAAKRGERVKVYAIEEDRWMPEGIRHPGGIGSWDFMADHGLLVTGGFDDTARLWNSAGGTLRCAPFEHADVPSGRAVLARLSPDGKLALTSSWHELAVRVWETRSGTLAANPLYLNAHVESFAVDPHSHYLATASDDRVLRIWDMNSGHLALPVRNVPGLPSRGRFQSDGGGFLAVQGREAMHWPLPAISHHAPAWFLDFAEQLAGHRLDAQGVLHRLPDVGIRELHSLIPEVTSNSEDPFRVWASWIATDPKDRPASLETDSDPGPLRPADWRDL